MHSENSEMLRNCALIYLVFEEQLGHELAPKWGDGIVGSSFTSYATTPAPYFTNFVQTHQL